MLFGEAPARWAARLYGLEGVVVEDAPTACVHQFAHGAAKGQFVQPHLPDRTHQGEQLGAFTAFGAYGREPFRPVHHDIGHTVDGLGVVDHGGQVEQTGLHRARGLGAGHGALAFHAEHQGRGLARYVSAAAHLHVHVAREARPHDVISQKAGGIRLLDGHLGAVDRQRVLVAHVEVGPRRAHRIGHDDQPFQYLVGVAFVQAAVLEHVRLALVRVADHVLGGVAGLASALPLDACGEARAPAPPQPGVFDQLDDLFGGHGEQHALEGLVPAPRDVVIYGFGVYVAQIARHYTLLELPVVQLAGGGYAPDAHLGPVPHFGAVHAQGQIGSQVVAAQYAVQQVRHLIRGDAHVGDARVAG